MTNSELVIASLSKFLIGIAIVLGGVFVGAILGAIKAPFYLGVFDGHNKPQKNTIRDLIEQTKDKL